MVYFLFWSLSGLAAAAETPLPIHRIEDVAYTVPASPDEKAQKLDIYAPTEPGPWPVLVFLHGHGESKGSWRNVSETLAEQGMVVITPSWRDIGSSIALLNHEAFAKGFRDITCTVRFARKKAVEYRGDATRVTLMGFSLGGGYGMAVALGGEIPDRAFSEKHGLDACVVPEASAPAEAFVGVAGAYDYIDRPKRVDLKPTYPDLWQAVSPYALIEQKKNPTLRIYLIHGKRDGTIPFDVSVKFHNALQTAGYESTLTLVPDMWHGFSFVGVGSEGKVILKAIKDVMRD